MLANQPVDRTAMPFDQCARKRQEHSEKFKKINMKRMIRVVAYAVLIILVPVGTFFLLPSKVEYHIKEKYLFSSIGTEWTQACS